MEKNKKIGSRELSWLAFNYRVLQEAKDASVPLLERIQFMAIFSSNLDEYFKVRVATLKRLIQLKKSTRQKLDQDPGEELDQVLAEVARQQEELGKLSGTGFCLLSAPKKFIYSTKNHSAGAGNLCPGLFYPKSTKFIKSGAA